jgi:steroid delta-isomerase-like uncharacterized protein
MTPFKNIFFALGLIFMLSGCEANESEETKELRTTKVQLETNLKMYEEVWDEIINKRNIEAINEASFEKDVTIVMWPENIKGIEAFKAYYNNYLTGFSNVSFTIVDAFGQENKIVKHWNFKGTHTGDFFGISATGKTVDIDGVTLVKMKDGKIAQEQDFLDNLEFMQQLGLIER